jgi:DNA-binding MarR family transcriptional regulator
MLSGTDAQTHQGRPRPEVVADIRAGATRLARRLRAERPPGGLSGTKLSVLSHLRVHGPSSPGEIAAAEGHQPQSLTRVLTELESELLILRRPSPTDGRSSILELTAAAQTALAQDMAARDAWLVIALSQLSDVEIELLRLAANLMDQLASASTDQPEI